MPKRSLTDMLCMDEFLVCYDLPRMSGLWGVLVAPSADAIAAVYPELSIIEVRPRWMSEDRLNELRGVPLSLQGEPAGLLVALVADRTSA